MPEYDNRNSGLLFKSTSDHPKAPAFSGFWTNDNNEQIKIKAYWSDKPDKNGNKFLQVSKDNYEKEVTDTKTGYDIAREARQSLDTPQDESPINLDDIPF